MRSIHLVTILTLMGVLFTYGCGEEERSLEVRLVTSNIEQLNPFAARSSVQIVRIFVTGSERHDDLVIDVAPQAGVSVRAEGLLSREVNVAVEGFDASGTVVAYGRSRLVNLDETDLVEIRFRRSLAYMTHQSNELQKQPGAVIYAIDLASRSLVDTIRIPGTNPVARSIHARGGNSMIVTWQDGAQGFTALLSLEDHSLSAPIQLPGVQTLTVGAEASSLGVSLGGGRVGFVNFDTGLVQELDRQIGGQVLDAVVSEDGQRVLAAVDVAPGLLLIDVQNQVLEAQNVTPSPSALALDVTGQVAFVTSSVSAQVVAFDLTNRRVSTLPGALPSPVGMAVYSEALRAVLGVDVRSTIGRILALGVGGTSGLGNTGLETLENPMAIATDGPGRRFIVVSAGSSTTTAGLTIGDTFISSIEAGAQLYPGDPDDTFFVSSGSPDREPVVGRQRYQPLSVAIAYGR